MVPLPGNAGLVAEILADAIFLLPPLRLEQDAKPKEQVSSPNTTFLLNALVNIS